MCSTHWIASLCYQRFVAPVAGCTVTVTSRAVSKPPSCANTRTAKVPGSRKVTVTGNLLSGGIGGGVHPAVHGELPPSVLKSGYTLNCSGLKVTLSPAPLYTNHATRRPIAVLKPRPLPEEGAGRMEGIPSSVTIAVSASGSPTFATRLRPPSILTSGALFLTARPTIVWPLLLR